MEEKRIQHVPLNQLVCREQPRTVFDERDLLGLAQSIRENGILQPLLVRREGDAFVLLDGERRLRAARMAGVDWAPVIIDDREVPPVEVILRQLVLDCQRVDFKPLERARTIRKLMSESGWSASAVARKLGLSESSVSRALSLLALSPDEQAAVEEKQIAPSTAYELVKVRDPAQRSQLLGETMRHRLSRDRVARSARHGRAPAGKSRAPRRPIIERVRFVIPVGESRSITVAGPVARRAETAMPKLTLEALEAWINELSARIKRLRDEDIDLEDAVKLLEDKVT